MLCRLLLATFMLINSVYAGQGGGGGITVDGTVTPTIINQCFKFANGNTASGAIYFRQGFDVPSGASVQMNAVWPIDGIINLHRAGTLAIAPLSGLRLGPNFQGFANGGIIQSSSELPVVISLDNDITVTGQLNFQTDTTINCNNHIITLADSSTSRGSIITGSGVTVTFINGTILNVQDFATGYGPRFRSTSENSTYAFDTMKLVLAGDTTMTCSGISMLFPLGETIFRTTSRGTIDVYKRFTIGGSFGFVSMYLGPGITLKFNPTSNAASTTFCNLFLDNASLLLSNTETEPFHLAFGSRYVVRGNSLISAVNENVAFDVSDLFNIKLDLAPAAHLTLNGIDFTA